MTNILNNTIDNSVSFYENYDEIIKNIELLYLYDDKEWVIGYSGGKDSTAVLQLVYYTIKKIPTELRTKKINVVYNDTKVESPYISDFVKKRLFNYQKQAEKDKIPMVIKTVYPALNDSFFVNVIGRGYPAPNKWFRWCTDRLKIRPTSNYINQHVSDYGSVIIFLGSRIEESAERAKTIQRNEIEGKTLSKHNSLRNTWIYSPIKNWKSNDVWSYLLQVPSPWGEKNRNLYALYREAGGEECPYVIDNSSPPCGNSRFGCWVCTVVKEDKSMEALIKNGKINFKPLFDFRNWLKVLRDDETKRSNTRRDGTEGLGPFTYNTRKEILEKLIIAQKETGLMLISDDELSAIQAIWRSEQKDYSNTVISIENKIYGRRKRIIMSENITIENEILEKLSKEYNIPTELIKELRDAEQSKIHLGRRSGLPGQLRDIIGKYIK